MEPKRYLLAFLSATMFFIAGAAEILAGLTSKGRTHITFVSLGAMFLGCGLLWLAIGIKWKKEAAG